jgi:hypothetical protein
MVLMMILMGVKVRIGPSSVHHNAIQHDDNETNLAPPTPKVIPLEEKWYKETPLQCFLLESHLSLRYLFLAIPSRFPAIMTLLLLKTLLLLDARAEKSTAHPDRCA